MPGKLSRESFAIAPFSASALPDYERLAAAFESYLPLIWPCSIILRALPEGARVLDVACGTGRRSAIRG